MPSLCEELCYSSASLVDEASEARRHNKKALPLCGKNLVIRAFLVEGASEARPHTIDNGGKLW